MSTCTSDSFPLTVDGALASALMRFGIIFANVGNAVTPEGATALATIAEESGFESLWTVATSP